MGQPRAASTSEFTPAVRLAVRRRAGRGDEFNAECEACGRWLGLNGGQVQHRLARKSGGRRNPVIRSAANAALLCGTPQSLCHGDAESRDPDREMEAMGFAIPDGNGPRFDPRNVPIMLHGKGGGGVTVYLAADGLGPDGSGYLYQRPQEVAA